MNTYNRAIEMLHGRSTKKIANNTYARLENGKVFFRLHQTDIVTVSSNGRIRLDTGGWYTHTTKERMNDLLSDLNTDGHLTGWRLTQDQGTWYLHRTPTGYKNKLIFKDGLTIHGKNVIGAGQSNKGILKLQKSILQYSKEYAAKLVNGEIEPPSSGDCWYCLMNTQDGQSLGEATKNKDHLLSHLEEKYYVPSLLVRATKFQPVCRFTEDLLAHWIDNTLPDSQWQKDIAKRDILRSMKQYLRHELGLPS